MPLPRPKIECGGGPVTPSCPRKNDWPSVHRHSDWNIYNERLVRRGEFYLSLDFIEDWNVLFSRKNAGMSGRPFRYPEPHNRDDFHSGLPPDALSPDGGIYPKTFDLYSFPCFSGYTPHFHCIKRLDLSFPVDPTILSHNVIIAVDSTGITVTNRGEWRWEKGKVRRGWIKIHAMIDVEINQILSLVTMVE